MKTADLWNSVAPVYKNEFPENYVNDISGWAFSAEEIAENQGKILTMDIDFGPYCSLNCPNCFRIPTPADPAKKMGRQHSADIQRKYLTYNELKANVLEAKKLGLRSVKFLGKGDMFENESFFGGRPNGFLDFLEFLNENEIIPLIFTKGQVLGNDDEVAKHFGYRGISTSEQLIKELKRLNCRIMLGFNAWDDETQKKMTGQKTSRHLESRNQALELLIKNGFNDPEQYPTTRLALATNPVTKANYDDIFKIYEWARKRHIYCLVTPSMMSGRGSEKINPPAEKLVDLYTKIYKWNIDHKLQTWEQVQQEGISAYAGAHPCNQISAGVYLTATGTVLTCPGEEKAEGDVRKASLTEIWQKSFNNRNFAGIFNVQCPAKAGKTIPRGFYTKILQNLAETYKI